MLQAYGSFRFDCLFYYVTDLDRAIVFYETVLGFRLWSRDAVARFHVDGVLFELVPTTDATLVTGTGNARLTVQADDIEAVWGQLRGQGLRLTDIRKVSKGWVGSLYDPDGNEICVWQPAKGQE